MKPVLHSWSLTWFFRRRCDAVVQQDHETNERRVLIRRGYAFAVRGDDNMLAAIAGANDMRVVARSLLNREVQDAEAEVPQDVRASRLRGSQR